MPDPISISQLTRTIKATLNHRFTSVWVEGEISDVTQATSGHVYLTLKDAHAQINAIIWRGDAQALDFQPAGGMKVICRGGIDVYPRRGSYQLIIRRIIPQGVGKLQLAFKQLHAKLAAQGLFDDRHKQSIPRFPKHIAVVTSPTGAAVRDFLQVLLRRWPEARVTIVPARVQGESACREVVAGIRSCHQMVDAPDVIVLTRGGGSIEDLWAFNEEPMIREIAAATIPVVTGVGHEIDVTLADLAADVRALTPSEAAERIVPEFHQLKRSLTATGQRMRSMLIERLSFARQQVQLLASRPALKRPLEPIRQAAIELDYLEQSMHRCIKDQVNNQTNQLAAITGRLNAANPLQILQRGYSVTTTADGRAVTEVDAIVVGETLHTRIADGEIVSVVQSVQAKK